MLQYMVPQQTPATQRSQFVFNHENHFASRSYATAGMIRAWPLSINSSDGFGNCFARNAACFSWILNITMPYVPIGNESGHADY